MSSKEKARRWQIACGFLMFFSLFFEKIIIGNKFYSVWSFAAVVKNGSIKLHPGEIIGLLPMGFVIIIMILYLIRSLLLIYRNNAGILSLLHGPAFIIITAGLVGMQFFLIINIVIVVADYMGFRYFDEAEERNAAYAELKERERQEKERNRRIRYFPGRYPEEFFRMIRKNYAYGKKGQMILASGCFLTAACLYIMLTMYSLITKVHGKEDFLSQNGLVQIFLQTGLLVALFSIVMMTMIISYYIKDQKKSYRLLVILGMRSRTVLLMFAVVFGANLLLAGALGIVCGAAVSYIIRDIWQSGFLFSGMKEGIVLESVINGRAIGLGLLAYLIVMLLALGFNQDNVTKLTRSMDMNTEVQKEKRQRKFSLLFIILGGAALILGVIWFSVRSWAESTYIHMFSTAGIILLLIGGITLFLNRLERNQDRYNKNIIASRPFYYRYWKSLWNLVYLTMIHFFILAVFAVQFTGSAMKQSVEKMYPYDIVCTAYDADMERLTEIAKEHDAGMEVYPMFRMTSIYGSDKLNNWAGSRPIQWPQGQHTAISETAYRSLKKAAGKMPEKLKLSGNEMHVVYQQDLSVKAHTIDWDTMRKDKRLRIGQPLSYYNTGDIDNIYPVWKVKSEERDILTGTFHQGMEENLIVFNDEYFQKVYEKVADFNEKQWPLREKASFTEWRNYSVNHTSNMTEGPTKLLCLSVPKDEYSGMLKDMQYLEDKYEFDRMWDRYILPFYGKQQMTVDTGAEIFFRRLVYLFIVVLLTIMGLFQYYVKFQSEAEELNWQNNFLKKLGMREKDRKKAVAGQLRMFAVLPLAAGSLGGLIFGSLTAKARLFRGSELSNFALTGAIVYLVYICIWAAWYFRMKRKIWRQAQWEK